LTQNEINAILQKAKTIAIVGLSSNPQKHSFEVGLYLKHHGCRIIPVNPLAHEILGEKSYKGLLNIPEELQKTIDIVDIFRKPSDVPPIVGQAIQLKTKFGKQFIIWMQQGIVNEIAAETARKAGLIVVMDKCLMVEHHRMS
jgi:predicted CoA-binding protein